MTSSQKQFVHDLIAELVGLDKNKVIWANQNRPKAVKPFVTLRLYAARKDAMAELRQTSKMGNIDVMVPVDAKLEVQYFCEPGVDPGSVIEQMALSLERPTIVDRCAAARLAFFDAGEILDTTMLIDAHTYESRAAIDLDVRYNAVVTDDVGNINEVSIAGATDSRNLPVDVKGGN